MGRALVGALVIGSLVFGAFRFVRSTLGAGGEPQSEEVQEDPGPEDARGRNLDIVLPEEGPGDYSADDGLAASVLSEEPVDALGAAPAGIPGVAAAPAAPAEALASKAFAAYEEDDSEAPGSLLDDAGEAAIPAGAAVASPNARVGSGLDELDVLPDLEGFSDSFAAPEYNPSDSVSNGVSNSSGSRSSMGRQNDTAGLDPAALAQAVRTILKRDTKG
ncbi:MAG TPA: hypothetical protein VMC79_03075 [Rectinemataceae bacterium]|nr:hypothetical protein [Rectinemataceae bacterium]